MKLVNKLGSSYNTYADMVKNFVETEMKKFNITTLQSINMIESVNNGQCYGNTERKIYDKTPISNMSLGKNLFERTDIAIKNTIMHELYHIKFFEDTYKSIDYNYIYSIANNPKSIKDYILLIGFKAVDEFYATYNAGIKYLYPSISISDVKYPHCLISTNIQTFKTYVECLNIGGSPNIPHLFPKIDEYMSWIVECMTQSKLHDSVGIRSMDMIMQDELIGDYVKHITEYIFETYENNLYSQEACIKCGEIIFSIFEKFGGHPVVDECGIMTVEVI